MSNTRRPTLAKKSTPKTEANRKAALDAEVSIDVDGTVYTIVPADLTGLDEMRIRRETGMSVSEIVDKLQSSPGIDILGCFMFACEINARRDPDLEAILGSISYASEVEVVERESKDDPLPQP